MPRAPVVGMLEAGYEDILVTACTPFVEASVFEERDFAGASWRFWTGAGWRDRACRCLRPADGRLGRGPSPPADARAHGRGLGPGNGASRSRRPPRTITTARRCASSAMGHAVRILYERPRDGLAAIGGRARDAPVRRRPSARRGVLEGRARLFSGRCDTLDYSVSGVFAPGRTNRPHRPRPGAAERGGCRVVGTPQRRRQTANLLLHQSCPEASPLIPNR